MLAIRSGRSLFHNQAIHILWCVLSCPMDFNLAHDAPNISPSLYSHVYFISSSPEAPWSTQICWLSDLMIYFLGDLEIPRVFPCSKIAATLTHHTAQPCGIEPKDAVGPVTFFHHSWPLYLSSSLLKFDGFIFLIFFVLRSYLVLSFFPCLLSWLQSPIDSLICSFIFSIHRITLICLCLVHAVFVCWCSDLVVNSVTYRTCCSYFPMVSATDQITPGHCHLQCAAGMSVGRGASFVPRSQNNSPGAARASQMARCSADHWAGERFIVGTDRIGHVSFQWFQSVSVQIASDNHIVGSRFQMCWALWHLWHCIFWAWVSNRPTLWIVKL